MCTHHRRRVFFPVLAGIFIVFPASVFSTAAVVEEPDPSSEPTMARNERCDGNRSYIVTVDYTWRPMFSVGVEEKGPGFVALLCVAHGPKFSLWRVGNPNSPSLTMLLRTQNFSSIRHEIKGNQSLGTVSSYNTSSVSVVKSSGTDVVNVTVSPEINATLISCIAAITPTPDWFIGISDLEMCEFEKRKEEYSYPDHPKVINLLTYDAEFNDQEIPLREPIPVSPSRPVRGRFGLGAILGTAEIGLPRAVVPASQTSIKESGRRRLVECFPGSAVVEPDDGRRVLIRDLSASQTLRTGRNSYSEVFMFSHYDRDVWAEFVTLHFVDRTANKSGALRASRGHYVYVRDDAASNLTRTAAKLRAMDTVTEGDSLLSRDGSLLRVAHIVSTWEQGLYNPHTVDGDLMVDGVRVSCFTTAVKQRTAMKVIQPLRVLYTNGWRKTVHYITRIALFGRFNAALSRLLPSGMYSHRS